MKIGELSAATAVSIETLRYYEREGLLASPERSASNYRLYSQSHVARVAFVRRCRALDMNLDEIRTLLRFKDAQTEDCTEVNALLDRHIDHVGDRVRELSRLNRELRALRRQCKVARDVAHCGILSALSEDPMVSSRPSQSHVGRSHDKVR